VSVPVTVIGSRGNYFYFSEQHGLVAIKFTGATALSEFYVSVELNGFGAKTP
jgi:hypothetical protein